MGNHQGKWDGLKTFSWNGSSTYFVPIQRPFLPVQMYLILMDTTPTHGLNAFRFRLTSPHGTSSSGSVIQDTLVDPALIRYLR